MLRRRRPRIWSSANAPEPPGSGRCAAPASASRGAPARAPSRPPGAAHPVPYRRPSTQVNGSRVRSPVESYLYGRELAAERATSTGTVTLSRELPFRPGAAAAPSARCEGPTETSHGCPQPGFPGPSWTGGWRGASRAQRRPGYPRGRWTAIGAVAVFTISVRVLPRSAATRAATTSGELNSSKLCTLR